MWWLELERSSPWEGDKPSVMSFLPAIVRFMPLMTSVVLHIGIVSAAGGHASIQRSGNGERELDVAVEAAVLRLEAPAPETPADETQHPSLAAVPTHHHDYPVPPSHDARPHDPSLVHTPAALAPLAAPAPEVIESQATEPASLTLPTGIDSAPAGGKVATNGRPDGVPGGTGTASAPGGTPQAMEPIIGPRYDVAYLKNAPPQYPPVARRLKLEGTVTLRVLVSMEGRPQRVSLQRSSGVGMLDEAALKAVQGWSFVPAHRGNDAIATEVNVPVRFRLQ